MSIDRGRLYRIESGIANPYPEEIRLMADLYNVPELEDYYCINMCPLGDGMPRIDIAGLDRISLKALSSFRKLKETKKLLLDITENGVIEESEMLFLPEKQISIHIRRTEKFGFPLDDIGYRTDEEGWTHE